MDTGQSATVGVLSTERRSHAYVFDHCGWLRATFDQEEHALRYAHDQVGNLNLGELVRWEVVTLPDRTSWAVTGDGCARTALVPAGDLQACHLCSAAARPRTGLMAVRL